jgi:hypothetical protein
MDAKAETSTKLANKNSSGQQSRAYQFSFESFKKKNVPRSDLPAFDIQPTLYPVQRSTLSPADEVRAKKCAARISLVLTESQQKLDFRLRPEIDAADVVAIMLWDRMMSNLYCRFDFQFIYDESMAIALMLHNEPAKGFMYGETGFDRFRTYLCPPSQRLSDCYFYPQHFDYENVSCIRIKFAEERMREIAEHGTDYFFQCGRVAQFFQMVRSAEARLRAVPISNLGTMRFFTFFTKSRL